MKAASLNHVYRLIWNNLTESWVVVSEICKAKGKMKSLKCGLVASGLLLSGTAVAAPSGGVVTSGSGSISQTGDTTTINQASQTLNLNWNTFNVAAHETVNFVQPSATALAVNRILDTNGSRILGKINANGQVWLINPNGVYFGQGAQINVGSLLASTLNPLGNINSNGSSNGTQVFGSGGTGSIINEGSIHAANGGYVAFIGNTVVNNGSIVANRGAVAMGAGSQVRVTFADNQLLSLAIDQSALNNLAENKGFIKADGGVVLLSAGAKDSLLASVVNNEGFIEARTVDRKEGKIILLGGMAAGTTKVAGTLDASASAADNNGAGNGGFIETSAAHVKVADTAKVSTQAQNGQTGTWLIDPVDFTVAVSGGDMTGAAVSAALGSNNFQIMSTNGASGTQGDININDAISWSADNTFTLTALRNININNTITATGANGKVALEYGQADVAAGNTASYNFGLSNSGFAGKINLQDGNNFSTKLGSDGNLIQYQVISSLGLQNSTTGNDLQGINGNLSGNYVLGADIDASMSMIFNSGDGFTAIGTLGSEYTGNFDGLGHTINGLFIDQSITNYNALFGFASGGSISNVGLTNVSIKGNNFTAALVGYSQSVISNSYSTGQISAGVNYDYVGGLVGYLDATNFGNVKLSGSFSAAQVSGNYYVGGLLGYTMSSSVSNSYASGSVTGVERVGGLVGESSSNIYNSYATGTVSGEDSVGGLVGTNYYAITNSYATGTVSGQDYVGGLTGNNWFDTSLSNVYATGNVTGNNYIGGLVGYTFGQISYSYATGNVSGSSNVGGLIGYLDDVLVEYCYSAGQVTGVSNVGGFVGASIGYIINSFYDIETSGQAYGSVAIGKTTAEMKNPFTFIDAGWDFVGSWGKSTTGENSGYMMLRTVATNLYDDYIRVSNGSRNYGAANSTITGANITGVGASNVTLNWGSAVNAGTSEGSYAYSLPNVINATTTAGRTVYIDRTSGELTINPPSPTANPANNLPASAESGSVFQQARTTPINSAFNTVVETDLAESDLSSQTGENRALFATDEQEYDMKNDVDLKFQAPPVNLPATISVK